jgi:Zn finger protein HypA/HybF involved in hydrogenase expression
MKKIKCTECDGISGGNLFNTKTLIHMKKNGIRLKFKPIKETIDKEDYTYICPKCNQPIKTQDLEEVI